MCLYFFAEKMNDINIFVVKHTLKENRGVRIHFEREVDYQRRAISWSEVLELWQEPPTRPNFPQCFAHLFTQTLTDLSFKCFFWECVPMKDKSEIFECVIIDAPALVGMTVDSSTFQKPLESASRQGQLAVSFPNLNGDTTLLSPVPISLDLNIFTDLASFLRGATWKEIRSLWAALGREISQEWDRNSQQPLWVSTSGLGVSWLHIRLSR